MVKSQKGPISKDLIKNTKRFIKRFPVIREEKESEQSGPVKTKTIHKPSVIRVKIIWVRTRIRTGPTLWQTKLSRKTSLGKALSRKSVNKGIFK